MKIYHTATQEDYDALMIELEIKGYKWLSGHEPTDFNYWEQNKENSYIKISDKCIVYRDIEWCKEEYPNIPIIEYKAKGENMLNTECKQCHKKLHQDSAKYCSMCGKKLVDEPEFKAGDIVSSEILPDGCGIVRLEEDLTGEVSGVYGIWYTKNDCEIQEVAFSVFKEDTRHATPEEIAEYEVALTFHKHGRKPFDIKRGDVVYLKGYDKNIFLDSGNIYKKHNFVDGDVVLVKTAEEVNEWLGVSDDK